MLNAYLVWYVIPRDTISMAHKPNTVIIRRSLISDYAVDRTTDNHHFELHHNPPTIKLISIQTTSHLICNALL